jgi:hypothetical protein
MNMMAPRAVSTLVDALALARHGLRVFPIAIGTKRPAIKGWKERASSDPVEINKMWAGLGDSGIGVRAGDGLLIVDIDKKDPETTAEQLQFKEKYGKFPKSWTVITPGNGHHVYYRVPSEFRTKNSVNRIGPGIDIRSEGGLAVGVGSSDERGSYRWQEGRSPNDCRLASAPEWLLELCLTPSAPSTKPAKSPPPLCDLDTESSIARARKYLINEAPEAIQGSGGREATKHVIQRVGDFGISAEKTLELLLEPGGWDDTKASPSWSSTKEDLEQLERFVLDLWNDHRERPAGCERPIDPADAFEVVELAKPQRSWETANEAAAAALANPPRRLIDGLLDLGATVILFGPSNAGKTAVALSMSEAIASGTPWGGRKVERGLVFYLAAEGGSGVRRRVAALLQENKEKDDPPLALLCEPLALFRRPPAWKLLREYIRAAEAELGTDCVLLVIDTAAITMAGMDENDASQVSEMFQSIGALKHEIGCAVLLLHHTGKDASRGERGSYALRANADISLEITEVGGGMGELHSRKQRDNEKEKAIRFKIESAEIGATPDGSRITAAIARICGKEEAWKLDLTTKEALLFDAFASIQARRADAGEGSENAPVTTAEWNAELAAEGEGEPDAKGRAGSTLREHRSNLVKKGWIKRVDKNSWICA